MKVNGVAASFSAACSVWRLCSELVRLLPVFVFVAFLCFAMSPPFQVVTCEASCPEVQIFVSASRTLLYVSSRLTAYKQPFHECSQIEGIDGATGMPDPAAAVGTARFGGWNNDAP